MQQLLFVCKRAQGFCVYLLLSAENSVLMVTQNSVALEREGWTAAADLAETAPGSEQEALCWFLFNKLCAEQGNPSWLVWSGGRMTRMIPDDGRIDMPGRHCPIHSLPLMSFLKYLLLVTLKRQNSKLRWTVALTMTTMMFWGSNSDSSIGRWEIIYLKKNCYVKQRGTFLHGPFPPSLSSQHSMKSQEDDAREIS